jgi:hypothetical protein
MNKESNLRQVFVQMLFALAVGQVALKCGEAINLKDSNNIMGSLREYHYIYSHLLLCIVILTTSWVGWQISQSIGNTGKINSIFSLQYVILLLDIFLVLSYFVIVRGAEIDFGNHTVKKASIFPEATWSMIIFLTYIFWDFFTKGITISYEKRNDGTYKRVRRLTIVPFLKRTWQTIVCLGLTMVINYCTIPDTPIKVTMLDLCLVMVFLIFRGLKQDIKRTYNIHMNQIPDVVASISNLDKTSSDVILVSDGKYWMSIFIVRVLPLILLVVLFLLYYLN